MILILTSKAFDFKLFDALKGKVELNNLLTKGVKKTTHTTRPIREDLQALALLPLYSNQAVTIKQFTAKINRHFVKRKVELELILETQKDTEEQFRAFQKQVALFAQLDIDDEHVLKQLFDQVIQKIKIHSDGSIKIKQYTSPNLNY
ncbi:hypothetical protein HQN89_31480 [Paenibacillus frigoriresistens]|uniref:hypothetical protein n=1 Tax=Paenibacillus alginolyticus TaxID=59839 RepID=UPI001565258B|nr:hypothetical protein [Paenibacillus frigoriresistens]NRF95398.1 hypothetical protein [Paenibacillus frigoriresistens]